MASVEAPKAKKTSSYFTFCKQHREQTKARLKEAGQPVSAPALTKALSELWRSLSDEEKLKYKDPSLDAALPLHSGNGELGISTSDEGRTRNTLVKGSLDENVEKGCAETSFSLHAKASEIADAQVEKQCVADALVCTDEVRPCSEEAQGNVKEQGDCLVESGGLVFPLARVKRIIKLDKDIRVVAADASSLIAQASQLFLEHLAMAAHASALKKKHKTIRIEDVRMAIKSEQRIEDFLAEALENVLHQGKDDDSDSSDGADDPVENKHPKGLSNKKSKTAKKHLPEPPVGTRKIGDFFSISNNQSKDSTANAE